MSIFMKLLAHWPYMKSVPECNTTEWIAWKILILLGKNRYLEYYIAIKRPIRDALKAGTLGQIDMQHQNGFKKWLIWLNVSPIC